MTLQERAETFAELLLEGKTSPAQQELTNVACGHEATITADMEWWKALVMMAWGMGHAAGVEDTDRVSKRARRK